MMVLSSHHRVYGYIHGHRVGCLGISSYIYISMARHTTNTYSVLHPIFEKVLKTIQSCKTPQQLQTSRKMVDLFYDFVGREDHLIKSPKGYARQVLKRYYRLELERALINHPLFKL